VFMEKCSIEELLPQVPPFVMVDQLTQYESGSAETMFEIKEDNVMVKDGILTISGLMENVAQTSAARIGYYYKFVLRQPVKVGYIGAVRGMKVLRFPAVGETIRTRISVIAEAFGMVAFAASIIDATGAEIARADMKTAI